MTEHTNQLIGKAGQNLYALKILKAHGLSQNNLENVTKATLISRLQYASPAWFGFASAEDLSRIQSVLNKAHRWGLAPNSSFSALNA